jgi:hypothetical protein
MKRILIILLMVPLLLFGQFAKVGSVGAKFLNVGIGTHSMGMAQAFSAVGRDAEAIFWNPAGIAQVTGTSIFIDRVNHWDDIGITSVAITQTIGFAGVFGFFYSGLTSGQWEETSTDQPEGTNNFVEYRAFQTGITYARFLTDRFSFGVNLKLVREDYPDFPRNSHDVTGYAMDVGGFYKTGFRDLTIGLSIQHFGPDLTISGKYPDFEDGQVVNPEEEFESYPLPIVFRGGLAMNIFEMEQMKAQVAVDLIHPGDNLERYAIGSELSLLDILKFRVGYQLGGGVNEGVGAFNFGVGVAQLTALGGFEVGYSYSYGNVMPSIHRISVVLGL